MSRPGKWGRQSYVYAIGGTDQSLVKIGVSTDLASRCRHIQTGRADPVVVLWSAKGGRPREIALHEYFADRHVRGEWFEFPEGNAVELIGEAFAEMYPQPEARPAAPEPPEPRKLPGSLELPDGTFMTYEEVMAAIAAAEAAHPRPRVTREESRAAVLQHLRDQGSRIVGID